MKLRQLFEEPRTAVIAFGRMNPPTIGHQKLVDKIKSFDGDHYVFLSQSQKPKTDPLTFTDKLRYAKFFFPEISVGHPEVKTIIQALQKINQLGYTDLVYVAGSDRVASFEELINKYNGKEYNFETIDVVSAGERDPDADGAEGMSASKMRAAAAANDLESFKQGVPRPEVADEMFAAVRAGMGIRDEVPAESLEEKERTVADYEKDALKRWMKKGGKVTRDELEKAGLGTANAKGDQIVYTDDEEEMDEGFGDWFRNTFSGDPIFRAWYMTYKQDPKAAKAKFPDKHQEFLKRVQQESVDEGWFGFGEDDPIAPPEWLDPRVKAYWEKINPVDDRSIRSARLKNQIAKLDRFAKGGLTDQANKVVVKELKQYISSNESVEESNLVLDKSRLRSHIISLIADKIAETDDINQLAEWLKYIVGKELKPRGTRYQITSEDVVEACKMHKKKKRRG